MNKPPVSRRLLFILALLFYSSCSPQDDSGLESQNAEKEELVYGITSSRFLVLDDKIERNEFLGGILQNFRVSGNQLSELFSQMTEVFDIRKMRAGKPYKAFLDPSDSSLAYFVYEHNPEQFLRICFEGDTAYSEMVDQPVSYCYEVGGGLIYSSLYETIEDIGGDATLAWKLSKIYDWSVDFFRLQKGDSFRVIYEKKVVGGKEIGTGRILAAEFGHGGKVYQSYLYNSDKAEQYYDEFGASMKRRYLKAPLDYTRISSRFTRRRFHPVQKRYKAHLGVDYAAPRGTPIRSVGNGTVIAAAYSKYNGNYVKIRHTHSQATQYLHMTRIASGIKKGVHVDQGQIIGTVGSTGLATGPHLCFRFWENGVQINPLSVQAPPAEPLSEEALPAYLRHSDSLQNILRLIRLADPALPLEDDIAAK